MQGNRWNTGAMPPVPGQDSGGMPSNMGMPMPPQQYLGQNVWQTIGSGLGSIGKWLAKNPEVITSVAGTAADIWGASNVNKRNKELLALQREQMEEQKRSNKERERQQQLAMLMQAMASNVGNRY